MLHLHYPNLKQVIIMKKPLLFLILIGFSIQTIAQQHTYWQQEVDYTMTIDVDTETHRLKGTQQLVYSNHSPDVLDRVYYHLYFNAFQPGSMMDVRSRTIQDPDGRVRDRILYLSDEDIGFHNILSLKQDGKELTYSVEGTILVVELNTPIQPGTSTTFDMEFESQVPKQVRRSGNKCRRVEFSMSQWYPKLAEYDYRGWHPNPYIGREFHGVFGDFDVKITIDSDYLVGATGILQNPNEIGHGYEEEGVEVTHESDKITYHFIGKNVLDFLGGRSRFHTYKDTGSEWTNPPFFLSGRADKCTGIRRRKTRIIYRIGNNSRIPSGRLNTPTNTLGLIPIRNTPPFKGATVVWNTQWEH